VKKKQPKKLTLKKETLLNLSADRLTEVAGGLSFQACEGTVRCGDFSLNASCVTTCTHEN